MAKGGKGLLLGLECGGGSGDGALAGVVSSLHTQGSSLHEGCSWWDFLPSPNQGQRPDPPPQAAGTLHFGA